MSFVQIKSGRVELRKDNGALLGTITTDAVSADINGKGDLVVVTKKDGRVMLHKDNGALVGTIVTMGAENATFNGSNILVKKSNGQSELRSEKGALINSFY